MAHAFSYDVQGVRDYYSVLDVPHTATPDEIRRSYRTLALKFHPDRNSGSREAEERFKELAEAFHTLSDPERRDLYDVWGPGAPGRSNRLDDESANLDDAFTVFVQQFSAFLKEELPELPVETGPKVPSLPLRVRVTLAEVATGVSKEVRVPCAPCSGTGVQEGGSFEGWACLACGGGGEDPSGETFLVDVPAGALAGDRVRASSRSGGNLLAFVEVEDDPRFVRAGADVVLALAISRRRGWGSEVEVPTPTGSTQVKIPWGTPVGGALRIPGHGLPARSRSGNGDLIVKLVAEGTEGAWTVASPAGATPGRVGTATHRTTAKVATVVFALVLAGVTLALLGPFGSEIATAGEAGLAASDQPTLPPALVSQVAGAVGEQDPSLDSGAEASGTPPVDGSPAFRMPSAPVLTGLSLPGALDIAPTYSDQPIASLSPVRPEPRPTNATGRGLTAVTQVPRVRNAERVQQSLQSEYPIGLREARIGGRVEMEFHIDAQGRVERFQMRESSGHSELDAAATRVARVFEFSPALRGTERVATSVTLGITFGDAGAVAQAGAGVPSPNQPVPADFDVAPQVSNTDRVRQSLLREYPSGLRDAGVGGPVEMWFYVNQQGVVERFQIRQGSGTRALDEAAMRVARVFQFTPARRAGQPIATWISLRITFVGGDPD